MARRAKFADAAETWIKNHAGGKTVSSDQLWIGLCETNPALTAKTETRKTPRTTCMRDLRKDDRFEVGDRKVRLLG